MKPETVKELRSQFNNIVDVLASEGFCTSRECMCDTSAPVVKMNAAITELEQELETQPTKETTQSGTCC